MVRRPALTRAASLAALLLLAAGTATPRAAGGTGGDLALITGPELRDWLTYIASDELQGRAVFSTGIGLAAGYIEDHLRAWGVKPAGDAGSYLQTVRVLDVRSTSRSSVTVDVNGERRTFPDGQGVTFPKNVGGARRLVLDRVEFAGYALDAPGAGHSDFTGKSFAGAALVWLGNAGPKGIDQTPYARVLKARNRHATQAAGAAASIGPEPEPDGNAQAPVSSDFTTSQRLDNPVAPNVTASDAFFTFLFSHAPVPYGELRRRAAAGEPLPAFRLDGVTVTFNIDADYRVVRTQLAYNIVGTIEGSDPRLKSTYVAFGAHYDHVGYADGEVIDGRRTGRLPGRVTDGALADRIWNGADDDGSGTVSVMAIARAFAQGPRPKRSILLVWHTGEEQGLLGSRYFADYPEVPLDHIVAQLNVDMVGRNRDDRSSEGNTVYLIGSGRISSELDAVSRDANAAMRTPLSINYDLDDPADVEQLYFRSDHYSYAARGVPVIFFTTGLHADYHANTDEVGKIDFGKMTRIAQMIYETGWRVANLDHAPVRDNRGARAGHPAK